MTLSIGLAYIYYLSLHAQNTEHNNASQAFVVQCCATSAVKLSVLTTRFKLGVRRISNPAGIPAGFDEFSKSGIRPDFLVNPAGFTGF